jgi:hypothetical protein
MSGRPASSTPPRCSGAPLRAESVGYNSHARRNLNATADRDGITIQTKGDVTFRIAANGVVATSITAKQWNLPGMLIAVEADGTFSSHPANSPDAPNALDVTYSGGSRIRLKPHDSGR